MPPFSIREKTSERTPPKLMIAQPKKLGSLTQIRVAEVTHEDDENGAIAVWGKKRVFIVSERKHSCEALLRIGTFDSCEWGERVV